MPNLTVVYLPFAFSYKNDITTKSVHSIAPSPTDIGSFQRYFDCEYDVDDTFSFLDPN